MVVSFLYHNRHAYISHDMRMDQLLKQCSTPRYSYRLLPFISIAQNSNSSHIRVLLSDVFEYTKVCDNHKCALITGQLSCSTLDLCSFALVNESQG